MHGHDLRRAGRTEEAIQEFLKAEELENEYYRAENIPPALDWHHAHNLQLLGMSYEALGQLKEAEGAYQKAFSLPTYTDFADYNRKAWLGNGAIRRACIGRARAGGEQSYRGREDGVIAGRAGERADFHGGAEIAG
jgi:tetratricopeptide (TPR) repeat protein